jgi:hypothetical protein
MKRSPLKALFGIPDGGHCGKEDVAFPGEILDLATKCLKGHSCLKARNRDLCEVDYSVQESVIFIKSREMGPCFYYNCFGSSPFCACPVRKKLYLLYHI